MFLFVSVFLKIVLNGNGEKCKYWHQRNSSLILHCLSLYLCPCYCYFIVTVFGTLTLTPIHPVTGFITSMLLCLSLSLWLSSSMSLTLSLSMSLLLLFSLSMQLTVSLHCPFESLTFTVFASVTVTVSVVVTVFVTVCQRKRNVRPLTKMVRPVG